MNSDNQLPLYLIINQMQVERRYLSGMTLDTYAIREYSYTVQDGEHKGTVIRQIACTPRKSEHEWGKQENEYWIEGKEDLTYSSIQDLIQAHLK